MENRRQTYRFCFESQDCLKALLLRPGHRAGIACEVHDLSLGGMRARLHDPGSTLAKGDNLIVRLLGRDAEPPVHLNLYIPSQVVALERRGDVWHCGISFLPIADPRANDELERTLSRFLLAEQRRKLTSEE